MKVSIVALLASLSAHSTSAFAPTVPRVALASTTGALFSTSSEKDSSNTSTNICDIPENVESTRLIDMPNGAKVLRDLTLTTARGATGPFFVSIGDATKLSKFLEINPSIPPDTVFVDDYNLNAYKAAGFSKLEFGEKPPKGYTLKAPEMGGLGGWWNYFRNVASVSPAPSATVSSEEVLESVLRLGGTFVIKGDEVVYQWNDAIPGDTPDLEVVLEALKTA